MRSDYGLFDPYWQDREKSARKHAEQQKWLNQMTRALTFSHADPEINLRRDVHQAQTRRAKVRPVTLPKVWK